MELHRFGYNARWGYRTDTETGLVYCQNRYYDPANGRWVTRDPIGYAGGVNLYSYCENKSVGWKDDDGLKKKLVILIGDIKRLEKWIGAVIAALMDKYEDEYEIVIRFVDSPEDAARYLTYADAAVYIGHGTPPTTRKKGTIGVSYLKEVQNRRKKLGKKKLDFLIFDSCGEGSDAELIGAALDIALAVTASPASWYPSKGDDNQTRTWYGGNVRRRLLD